MRPATGAATVACVQMTGNPLSQPLVFQPLFMERVWGGRRLESLYGKRLPPALRIGESWELVDRPEAQSVVDSGPLRGLTLHELWETQRARVFGNVPDAPRFPILAKWLDAQEHLSLQVHPPAAAAQELGGEPKSEFWYIADAMPKAQIFAGLKKGSTREAFIEALKNGNPHDLAHEIFVRPGDAIFLPSGRLHALGGGNLIVEIQQNSDTTYRVYDWNRGQANGTPRKIHVTEALRSIDFTDHEPSLLRLEGEMLIQHSLFEIQKWILPEERVIASPGSFVLVVCLTGRLECAGTTFEPGDFFVVPAELHDRMVRPRSEGVSLLRITMPHR